MLFTRALEQLAVPTALSANTAAVVKASLSMNLLYVGKLADLSPGKLQGKVPCNQASFDFKRPVANGTFLANSE